MDRIESLTPEQEAMLPAIRDKWIAIGLSTEPANRPAAEAGVAKAYRAAGLEPPKQIIWVGSPLEAQRVQESLITNTGASDQSWQSGVIGLYETSWLAYYYTLAEFGADVSALDGLCEVEMNAGWWWPLSDAAVISERPQIISRDKDLRLHREDGPAVLYPDGFSVYAWHGTRVPKDLIEDGWDTERILSESNTEIRRCAIERMGWDAFIRDSGMQPASEALPDPGNDPHTVQLYDLPSNLSDMFEEAAKILMCTNGSPERDGTRHRFGLVVPGHHTDPIEAAADLYGWPVEAYRQLEVRR